MTAPLISVLVDTYNHEHYIDKAIVSVLEQDFPAADTEILVVDDGSLDRTPEIARKFQPRVRLIQKQNGGQASAFNVGIAETQADLVAFLDGDDFWASEKLSAVMEAFRTNPGVAAVGHGFFEVDDSGQARAIVAPEGTCRLDLSSEDAARVADVSRTLLGTSRLSIRRETLNRIGPIPEQLVFCADTPLLTLALALGGAVVLDLPLCSYRRHSQSLFANDSGDEPRLRRKYEILAFLLAWLPQRLAALNVPGEAIAALLESDQIELARFRLSVGEGTRWATFRTELRCSRWLQQNSGFIDMAFRGLVGALALLLPPRRFYELRNWYSRQNLKDLRGRSTEPKPAVPGPQRRAITTP